MASRDPPPHRRHALHASDVVLGLTWRAVLRGAAGADEPPPHTPTRALGDRRSIKRMIRAALILTVVGGVAVLSAQSAQATLDVSSAQQPPLRFEVASIRLNTGDDGSISFPPTPPDGMILLN